MSTLFASKGSGFVARTQSPMVGRSSLLVSLNLPGSTPVSSPISDKSIRLSVF